MIIQLRRGAHIFLWFRFAYAEGDNSHVKIVFDTHSVSVSGHGLAVLLAALTTHRVVKLIQPTENEAKLGVRGDSQDRYAGPAVTSITVAVNGDDEEEEDDKEEYEGEEDV